MSKERFDEIDLMRILGFLMVLDQHILGAHAQRQDAAFGDAMILHFMYLLGRPAVPMFIAITGFTLFYVYHKKLDVGDFYKKRFATIVMPYLFWSIASIVILRKYDMLPNLIPILLTGTASYHLWYMAMSIRLYLWFPIALAIITWLARKNSVLQKLAFVGFSIFFWIIFKQKTLLVQYISGVIFGTPSVLEQRFFEYSPIFWSLYFVCGAVIFFNYVKFKETVLKYSKLIFITYIPVVLYMYYSQVCTILPPQFPRITYEHIMYIIFALQTIALIYVLSIKLTRRMAGLEKYITELGALSYGAYLVHVLVLQLTAPILRDWLQTDSFLLSGIIIFIVAAVLSFGICYVISFMPLSKYIIGVRTKKI